MLGQIWFLLVLGGVAGPIYILGMLEQLVLFLAGPAFLLLGVTKSAGRVAGLIFVTVGVLVIGGVFIDTIYGLSKHEPGVAHASPVVPNVVLGILLLGLLVAGVAAVRQKLANKTHLATA